MSLPIEALRERSRLLERWPATCLTSCRAATIKDVARRFGAGVASLPLYRFYVLIEGATTGPEDDLVLELRRPSWHSSTDASISE